MNIALIVVTTYLLGPVIAVAVLAAGGIEKLSRGLYTPVTSVISVTFPVQTDSESHTYNSNHTPPIDGLEVS